MKKLFSAFLLAGMLLTIQSVHTYYDDGGARSAFGLGATGAVVGGVVGGWKGAAIGGGAGFVLGGAIGSSRSRRRDPHYKQNRKLNRLYKRRDRLESRIKRAKSDKRRNRYQEDLKQVNYDIRTYEGPRKR